MRKYTIYGNFDEYGRFISKNITTLIDDPINLNHRVLTSSHADSYLGLDLNIQNTLMQILRIHSSVLELNTAFTYNFPITL